MYNVLDALQCGYELADHKTQPHPDAADSRPKAFTTGLQRCGTVCCGLMSALSVSPRGVLSAMHVVLCLVTL